MRTWTLVGLGLAEIGILATFGWSGAAHAFPWPGLAVFGAAFAVYAAAAWWLGRGTTEANAPRQTRTIWVFAVGMRLALLPLAPELSDDFNRYLWDGHVQLSGTNPYVHAPAAPELEPIRTEYHDAINNPAVPTIYPPVAQIAFLVIAMAGSGLFAMKLLWLMCDLGTGWILGRIARESGRNEAGVLLLYLWSPLLIIEVAWSGHLEPLGLLMLSAAIWAATRAERSRDPAAPARPADSSRLTALAGSARLAALAGSARLAALAGSALALSALTKFAPAAAIPALGRRLGWRPLLAFGVTGLALYAPYAGAGLDLFTGLRTYSEHWWFMKGAFVILESVAGDPLQARRLAGLSMFIVIGWTAYARFDLERALFWILGAGMILTPTLHPWYVLWMLPMAALRSARAWILLSGLAAIGYFGLGSYQATGDWAQPGLARAALWIPFFVVLSIDAWARLRSAPSEPELVP